MEELLQGAIDFHLHAAPDPYKARSADAHQVALAAKGAGMKAIVLKSHTYPTAPLAAILKKVLPGIEVIGGLALNQETGGMNPQTIEVSVKMGAKIIWMPTLSALADRRRKGLTGGIPILGADQQVLPAVREVLALVKRHGLVLCTGHLIAEEIVALFAEARQMQIGKFVLNHPLKVSGTSVDLKIQKELAGQGAFMEHCFLATTPSSGNMDPARIVEAIRFVGVEHCLLSTDYGKAELPPPREGMRAMLATMARAGLSREELRILVQENPARLLDL